MVSIFLREFHKFSKVISLDYFCRLFEFDKTPRFVKTEIQAGKYRSIASRVTMQRTRCFLINLPISWEIKKEDETRGESPCQVVPLHYKLVLTIPPLITFNYRAVIYMHVHAVSITSITNNTWSDIRRLADVSDKVSSEDTKSRGVE